MTLPATLTPIGKILTPYNKLEECPRNIDPAGPPCELVIKDELIDALMGLRAGQRILILYWFDLADRSITQQNSRRTGKLAGIFALRTPNRCNPIGAAVLPIEHIKKTTITVRGLDCLNGTSLIDIKPAMAME
jgi:tRNA-Thr(GGU) m(6)t(6)A37 methyltransferase TsaA